MAIKSPLAVVKERFGDKAKLVDALKAFVNEDLWLGRTSSDRGGSKGLENISNAKLRDRGVRLVSEALAISHEEARERLEKASWNVRACLP